jgi:UDP-N-acetylmuramoylalanine--D-glutamate ligase
VLEVSSFQLETTESFHPKVAVILNITPDHLDRHGSFENYAMAKERIFAEQSSADALVLNAENPRSVEAAKHAKSKVYWFSADANRKQRVDRGAWAEGGSILFRNEPGGAVETILPLSAIHLKGVHNVENVLAAVVATRLAGASIEAIRKTVSEFKAVEHRLEFVATIAGVDYYNDSKATNVDATAKAIAAFPGGIHLILGGKDKNSDYTTLIPLLKERVKRVYTIGAAAEKIEQHLRGSVPILHAETLTNAVKEASGRAQKGEIVLLAPACSSFDQFENYEHRGRVFKDLVTELRGLGSWQNA